MNNTGDGCNEALRPVNNPSTGNKKNPYTIWFVVISFAAPVALAYIMFFFGNINSFNNHGEILDPVIDIDSFQLSSESGERIPKAELSYKWRLISFIDSSCDENCVTRLYDSRQVYRTLGKNRHRVLRMFVHLDKPDTELETLIAEEHPNVIRVYGNTNTIETILGEGASITNNELYIMDPMGNVMMRFTQNQPKKDIQFDLNKLLKASQIG